MIPAFCAGSRDHAPLERSLAMSRGSRRLFILYPIIMSVYALYMPAACFAAIQADRGVVVSFRQAYGVARSRFGRYLWLMILWCSASLFRWV